MTFKNYISRFKGPFGNVSLSITIGTIFLAINLAYFSKLSSPFAETKWILLAVFAPAMAFGFSFSALFKNPTKAIGFNLTLFQLCLITFFFWAALSGLWTINQISYPGSIIDLLSILTVFFIFSFALHNVSGNIIKFFVFVFSTIIAAIGLIQYFGLDGNIFFQSVKPAAFMVNKNYATPIVAATLPLMALNALLEKDISNRGRCLHICIFHINIAYLLVACTKSSWLAYFGSMSLIFFIFLSPQTDKNNVAWAQIAKHFFLMLSGTALAFFLALLHTKFKFPPVTRDFLSQTKTIVLLLIGATLFPIFLNQIIFLLRRTNLLSIPIKYRLLAFPLLVGVIIIIFCSIYKPEHKLLFHKILDPVETGSISTSIRNRIAIWLNAVPIILDHPIAGVGIGSFDSAYPLYHDRIVPDPTYTKLLWYGGTHNELLQLLAELGLIGFGICITMVVSISRYYNLLRNCKEVDNKNLLLGCFAGALSLLIEGFFSPIQHQASCLMLLAIFAGVIHSQVYKNVFFNDVNITCFHVSNNIWKICLLSTCIIFLLILTVNIPLSFRRYQAFEEHFNAIKHSGQKNYNQILPSLMLAEKKWPYSSIILAQTAYESHAFLNKKFSNQNFINAWSYNQKTFLAYPYHYITNLIFISLIKRTSHDKSDIKDVSELLLKVSPSSELANAKKITLHEEP